MYRERGGKRKRGRRKEIEKKESRCVRERVRKRESERE